MKGLNEWKKLVSERLSMDRKIAEKYPCSIDYVRTLLRQFEFDQEKVEAYIMFELATGRLQ